MGKDNSDNVDEDSLFFKGDETEKSFVKKVRSRVSGLFNSSLSRLFGSSEEGKSSVKRREEDEEEVSCSSEPPAKRIKLPTEPDSSASNHINVNAEVAKIKHNSVPNDSTVTNTFNNFPEPVAGPSRLKSRKLITNSSDKVACTTQELPTRAEKDSDSGDSTSGYSSVVRAANKDSQETKKSTSTPINHKSIFNTSTLAVTSRSLFMDRSLSPQANSSLSSRRPSFNISTFGSPDFIDRTVSTKRIMDSPFYKGRTIYGGASTYSHKLTKNPSDMKGSVKESIRIKPINEKQPTEITSLSKTAQRILSTLEQYTTPVRDVKKIPISPKKVRQDDILSKYIGARPYTVHERKKPFATELQVPTVPELLKMKERLQDSTVSVRQIADSSKSTLNKDEYVLRTIDDEKTKYSNKMKAKISSVRQKATSNDTVESPKLPSVALPITTLPKFDFTLTNPKVSINTHSKMISETTDIVRNMPSSSTVVAETIKPTAKISETNDRSIRKESKASIEFKFSKPLVLAENIRSIIAINNFRFSKPVSKRQGESETNIEVSKGDSKLVGQKIVQEDMSKNNGELLRKKSQARASNIGLDALQTKSDDLMNKFKPLEGTWECSVCLIRNQPDQKRCVACESPNSANISKKDQKINPVVNNINEWECSNCKAYNKVLIDTCVTCKSEKSKSSSSLTNEANSNSGLEMWKCGSCSKSNKQEYTICEACGILKPIKDTTQISNNSSLSLMFKAASDTWECSICMIRNKNNLTNCAACETPKVKDSSTEKGFKEIKFKPPSNTWECPTCMIRNSDDKQACAACETLKPGSKSDLKKSSFGEAFCKKSGDWECPSCMVKNAPTSSKCVCCETPKVGEVKSSSSGKIESTFNFGIDKSGLCPFKFGIPTNVTNVSIAGSPANTIVSSNTGTSVTSGNSFVFSNSEQQQKPQTSVGFVFSSSSTNTQVGTISFGIPQSSSTTENPQKATEVSSTSNTADKVASLTGPESKNTAVQPLLTNGETVTSSTVSAKNATVSLDAKPMLKSTSLSSPNLNFTFGSNKIPLPTPPVNHSCWMPPDGSNQFSSDKTSFNLGVAQSDPKENTSGAAPDKFSSTPSFSSNKQLGLSSNTNKQTEAATFKFSSTEEPPSKKRPFSFSAPSATTSEPPKANPLSFGLSQTTGSTAGFKFSGPLAPSAGFNFTAKIDSTSTTENNATSKSGGFNFGTVASTNTTQKAGFSFGAVPQSQVQTSGGFNFATAEPAPATGGFNFSAPDPSFKSSFNFTSTSAMPTFNAQPTADGGAPAAARKMRRAIRRTTPR